MNKGTFFEEFFTKSNSDCKQDNGWSSSSSEDNDMGSRTLTFGIKKDECESKGCCWHPLDPNPKGKPWCYHSL